VHFRTVGYCLVCRELGSQHRGVMSTRSGPTISLDVNKQREANPKLLKCRKKAALSTVREPSSVLSDASGSSSMGVGVHVHTMTCK